MRGRSISLAARLALVIAGGLAVLSIVAATGRGAQSRADSLRAQDASLAARSRGAVLELYALESALARARVEASAAAERVQELRRQRASVEAQLSVARRAFRISERRLGARLRDLYQNGRADPVAILLGSVSLQQALSTLEGLHRFASQDRSVIRQARSARAKLRVLARGLAAREAALERERELAAATIASLERTRTARRSYLAALGRERALTARRIRGVEAAARAAHEQTARLAPDTPQTATGTAAPPAPPAAGGTRTLTVVATGYAIKGTTATGLQTAWGVVAVDPAVIPLGTRMTIPGYGEGVAADVGAAVKGAIIDLWFPTVAQALVWGRRTVTITLH